MKYPCTEQNCIRCCQDTEMPLSEMDIKRIMAMGNTYDDFAVEVDHWLQLRNRNGLCVFHDGRLCTIYEVRPEGCRSYPLLYDDDTGAVLDDECPHIDEMEPTSHDKDIIMALVRKLKDERKHRR